MRDYAPEFDLELVVGEGNVLDERHFLVGQILVVVH
jgi:hypothetical protein